jgi:hypothetical protein
VSHIVLPAGYGWSTQSQVIPSNLFPSTISPVFIGPSIGVLLTNAWLNPPPVDDLQSSSEYVDETKRSY